MVFPCCVHDGGAEAPGRVDAGAGDGNGRQVNHEHREPNRQRHEHLHARQGAGINTFALVAGESRRAWRSVQGSRARARGGRRTYGDEGVARRALGVGGGEDGVHEDEGADDLGGQGAADGVTREHPVGGARGHRVGAAAEGVVGHLHDPLDDAHAADGAQALRHDVQQRAHQRQLPPHEQTERHRRVDVPACVRMIINYMLAAHQSINSSSSSSSFHFIYS